MNTEGLRAHVAQGASFLDGEQPDWITRVQPDTLVMASSEHCLLGQLYGDYFDGRDALHLNVAQASAYGFTCAAYSTCVCSELTRAWVALITARRRREQPTDDTPEEQT